MLSAAGRTLIVHEGCAACGIRMFKSAAGRTSHFRNQHGQILKKSQRPRGSRLECPHCTETFTKGSGLSSHLASRHGRHVGAGVGAGAVGDDEDVGGGGDALGAQEDGHVQNDDGDFGGDYIAADDDEEVSLSWSSESGSCSSSSSRHRSSSDSTSSSGSGGGGGSDDDKSSKHSPQASLSSSSSDSVSSLSDDEKDDDKELDGNSSEDCVCEADEAAFPDVANAETRFPPALPCSWPWLHSALIQQPA